MKKILSVILALSMCLSLGLMLASCGHEHEWDTEWTTDETSHWHICLGEGCMEFSDMGEHQWNEGKITSEPSATADGVKTYECTVCGEAKKEAVKAKTDVTAAEWANAMKLEADNYSFVTTMTVKTTDAAGYPLKYDMTHIIKKNGNNIQVTTVTSAIPGITESEIAENMYYAKEGDKYYAYVTVEGETVKTEIEQAMFDQSLDLGLAEMFKFDAFTYADKAYTAATITVGEGATAQTFTNVTLRFVDGKLASIGYTLADTDLVTGNESTVATETVVEYGKVPAIILPSVSTPAA